MKKYIIVLLLLAFAVPSLAEIQQPKALAKEYEKISLGIGARELSEKIGLPHFVYRHPNGDFLLAGFCAKRFGVKSYVFSFGAGGLLFAKMKNHQKTFSNCAQVLEVWKSQWPDIVTTQKIYALHPDSELYNIDKLELRVLRDKYVDCLDGGSFITLMLNGEIGSDSSFAVKRILEKEKPCKMGGGRNNLGIILNSGGGLLEHGYKLGEVLRNYKVNAIVNNGSVCASSCAVAFLGGTKRFVAPKGKLLFHSPYYLGRNSLGSSVIACAEDRETLSQMRSYFQQMIGIEEGEILLDRTMSYCSQSDGWTITGNSAAELYGITQPLDASGKF
ncbi:hypothetical protein N9H90_11245 [Pseudomonadales bacterium]|nr:hypothetical protein [Pseudomonadales bacterium]